MFEIGVTPDDEAAAAAWVVRLSREPVDDCDGLAFVDWLDGAPKEDRGRRRRAFDRAQRIWLEADSLRDLEASPRHALRKARRSSTRWPAWAAAAAAALVLVAGPAVWIARRPGPPAPSPATGRTYATAPGERRSVILPDGSHVELDGGTRLFVAAMDGVRRDVTLTTGEASFDVVHDPVRPFRVNLGSAEVRVLGTAFDAVRSGDRVTVSVARGLVSFSTPRRQVRLAAGRSATLGRGLVQVSGLNPEDVGAWRRGRRLYWDQSLSVVVSDLNRSYEEPIRLGNAAAGRLRFTGVLVLGPEATVARRLTALLPLHSKTLADGSVVLSSGGTGD